MGIENALQLSRTHPALIRKNFSVVLERTVRELNGESCIPLVSTAVELCPTFVEQQQL